MWEPELSCPLVSVRNTGSRQSTSLSAGHPQPAKGPGPARGALLLQPGPLPGPHTPLWEVTSTEGGREAAALHPAEGLRAKKKRRCTLQGSGPLPQEPTSLIQTPLTSDTATPRQTATAVRRGSRVGGGRESLAALALRPGVFCDAQDGCPQGTMSPLRPPPRPLRGPAARG